MWILSIQRAIVGTTARIPVMFPFKSLVKMKQKLCLICLLLRHVILTADEFAHYVFHQLSNTILIYIYIILKGPPIIVPSELNQ